MLNQNAPPHPPAPLGPVLCATVVCTDLNESINFYRTLGTLVDAEHPLSTAEAAMLFNHAPASLPRAALVSAEHGAPLIRLVEIPDAIKVPCLSKRGWLALEISTNCVDALYQHLAHQGCRIHGKPANLDISDAIRAMQVEGPSGEMLYITQVSKPVPPFRLPMPRAPIDSLFIVVLSVTDREKSASFYTSLGAEKPLMAETKITVVNRAYGLPIPQKHPIAVLQLADTTLIEIDQITDSQPNLTTGTSSCYSGIHAISMASSHTGDQQQTWVQESIYNGNSTVIIGPDKELIQLIRLP